MRLGVRRVVVVGSREDCQRLEALFGEESERVVVCCGGASRGASVAAGVRVLRESADPPEGVLIHDGARPCVDGGLTARVVAALRGGADGVWPCVPVHDTLRDSAGELVSRDGVVGAQTPQGVRLERVISGERDDAEPDDVTALLGGGWRVEVVAGDPRNVKLTCPEDLALVRAICTGGERRWRCGHGYDVHVVTEGEGLMLCGVWVPCSLGVEAHSDGDVVLHALTDAILGAAGGEDIGVHFPPSDERWRGCGSRHFVARGLEILAAAGGVLEHVDVTVIAERPRLSGLRGVLRAGVAEVVGVPQARVNVKATTSEGLGFVGRGEGIAAHAVAMACFDGG